MSRPFNIRIFVVEGLPDGLRHVEKSNWVGLGIVCPRSRYPHVKKRAEFESSGVYLLLGSEGDQDRPTIYIGEADRVRDRLDSHHANKDFWQQAVVFTTKGDPLNKAEVQWLEARLVELAAAAKRCTLDNNNVPQRPSLSESDQAEVEGYLQEMLPLLPILGIRAFEAPASPSPGRRIYWCRGQGWDASGYEADDGFVVRAGSLARKQRSPHLDLAIGYDRLREKLIEDRVLVPDGEHYRFMADTVVASPSAAATVCAAMRANGRICWRDDLGATLKARQEEEAKS